MPYIEGVLREEYDRLSRKMADYLSKPANQRREEAIVSIRVDMTFIEKAFAANEADLPRQEFYEFRDEGGVYRAYLDGRKEYIK